VSRDLSITFMSGPQDGKVLHWQITSNDEVALNIGRQEGCDLLIGYDSQVSRTHARIIYRPHSDLFFLEDAGSRNGTFLGPNNIEGRVPLQPGDLFRVGRTWLRIDPVADTDSGDDLPF